MMPQYQPRPPYRVEYFCPRQAPYWQRPQNAQAIPTFNAAAQWADILKPNGPRAAARVVDAAGTVVYYI